MYQVVSFHVAIVEDGCVSRLFRGSRSYVFSSIFDIQLFLMRLSNIQYKIQQQI